MQTAHSTRRHSLRQLLPGGAFVAGGDAWFSACSSDPRRCQPGHVYVALETPGFDGHAHAAEAVQRGAVAIVAERHLPLDVPVCVVPDSREAYGQICHELAGHPARRLRMIGVAGTHGKTTTCLLTASVFRAAEQRTGTVNSLGCFDGEEATAAAGTTPPAAELADCLGRMVDNDCVNAVVEASHRALLQRRIAAVQFDIAVLTNLERDRTDGPGAGRPERRAPLRLLEHLKPAGVAIINADDPPSRSLLSHLDRPVLTIAMRQPADITAEVVECHAGEQTMLLTAGQETAAVQTQMFGEPHVYNCLSAAAVGLLAGLALTDIAHGLERLEPLPGRMEPIVAGQPFGVYLDGARTPATLAAALKTLRRVAPGRVLCVFGADAAREAALRPLLGRAVERFADVGIITNDNPRWENPLAIVHDILDGYARPSRAHVLPDRAEAIRWALAQARPGDAVLIAGKGDRRIQVVREQQLPFDDGAIARAWLREAPAEPPGHEEPAPRILPFRSGVTLVN